MKLWQCGTDVRLLKFKFRGGTMAPFYPDVYTGCIGGCDPQLNAMLEIRQNVGSGIYAMLFFCKIKNWRYALKFNFVSILHVILIITTKTVQVFGYFFCLLTL